MKFDKMNWMKIGGAFASFLVIVAGFAHIWPQPFSGLFQIPFLQPILGVLTIVIGGKELLTHLK